MLYFEDFMEAIENLPGELNESLTTVRQLDVQSEHAMHTIHETSKRFFENCTHERLSKMMVSVDHADIVKNYEKASALAREKCKMVDKIYTTYRILMRKLDSELDKFRLELEADNSGITEQIEHKTEMLLEKGSSAIKVEKRRQGFRFQRGSNFKTPFLIHRKIIGHACRTALRSSNVRPFGHTHKSDSFRNGSLPSNRLGHAMKHEAHMKDPSMTQGGLESVDEHGHFRRLQLRALSDADTPDSDHAYDSKPGVAGYPGSRSEYNPASESDFAGDVAGDLPTSLSLPSATPLTPKLSPFFTFPTPNLGAGEATPLSANRYHQTRLTGQLTGSSSPSHHGEAIAANSPIGPTYSGDHQRLYSTTSSTSPILPPSGVHLDTLSRQARLNLAGRDRRVRANLKRPTPGESLMEPVSSQASSSSSSLARSSSSRSLAALYMPGGASGNVVFDDSPAGASLGMDQMAGDGGAGHLLGNFFDTDGGGDDHDLPMLGVDGGGTVVHDDDDDEEEDDLDDQEDEEEEEEEEEDQKRYCLCRDVSYGDMIACDAPNCPFEWFHYHCVNLTVAPKGSWFCPSCVKTGVALKTKKRLSRR